MRLAGSAGEAHGQPLVPRTPCVAQRPVCSRRASPCPNRASAGFARCRTGCFLQFLIRAALLAEFLSKPTHTFPNRILPVAYFPALHPPCHLPLYAGCFPIFVCLYCYTCKDVGLWDAFGRVKSALAFSRPYLYNNNESLINHGRLL